MIGRMPWTQEELDAFLPKLKKEIEQAEADYEDVKPLPPMTVEECADYLLRLIDRAKTRTLNESECFFHGQLLSVFQQAVRAETLGKKGRFFVISEADINRMMKAKDA